MLNVKLPILDFLCSAFFNFATFFQLCFFIFTKCIIHACNDMVLVLTLSGIIMLKKLFLLGCTICLFYLKRRYCLASFSGMRNSAASRLY